MDQCFLRKRQLTDLISLYNYVVDAMDTVSERLLHEMSGEEYPVISCMGAGNKLDPTRFEVVDIFKPSSVRLPRLCVRSWQPGELGS